MKLKILAFLSLLSLAGLAQAQDSEDWQWTIGPVQGSSQKSRLSVHGAFRRPQGTLGNVPGHDLPEPERQFQRVSRSSVSVGPGGPILGDLTVDAGMKMKLYDAGGIYRLKESGDDIQFDLLAGMRYVDVDVDLGLVLPGPAATTVDISTGPSETDLMLGARLFGFFADRWHWALRGDFSFGGTDGTYNGQATMGYTFGQSRLFTLTAGYRYMSIDIDGTSRRGSPTQADITMSGPVIGFVFDF